MGSPTYLDDQGVKRNMYSCTDCPRCKSEYRFPMKDRLTHCDDCGYTEPWDDYLKNELQGS